jgi:CRP-like cAMP-binding protein
MASSSSTQFRNQLLLALSAADVDLLRPHLQLVTTEIRKDLEEPNKPIKHVYFIESGFASVVATSAQENIEVGLIGREGMSGSAIVLGNHRSPHATYIQAAGQAQRISVAQLRLAMQASATMQGLFLKFVQVFMIQTAHTAISNARAKIDHRLARWILMAHDRIEGDQLPLTHEFLAIMLGVRRAGVTEALHILERRRLIKSQRGQVIMLDRKGMERMAGDLYGVPEVEYRRLIGA